MFGVNGGGSGAADGSGGRHYPGATAGGGSSGGGATGPTHHPFHQHQHQHMLGQQEQQAYYSQQHAGYQQWLPAQFAQFSLGGYPHNGATFYGPPMQPPPPPPGAAAGSSEQAPPYLPMPMPMALPPETAVPRGWGGMQLHDQQEQRGYGSGAGGGRGGPRGSFQGRGGGGSGSYRGGGGGRGQGRGSGRGRRGRYGGGGAAAGEGGYGPEELLLQIKRLPADAPLDEVALQGLKLLDSRGMAVLIKDLGKAQLPHRAQQLFDLVRGLGPGHELAALLDEFTFTSMISNCVGQQDLARALQLVEEMRDRGIERNVHTFSALMNVCIKCGQYKLALDVYRDMKAAGCPPNIVTMNTLIDVYGKSGQWEEALGVLEQLKRERIQPVTRTYNTLMIACNTSNQWQEALRVYDEMVACGHQPNTTTYNALISAHSKGGDLSKVLQIFKEMVQKGCERSVITYSSLISACEKAGEWKLALQLFEEMKQEGCVPNVISYNSLITACAQGAQWEKAAEVFEQMQRQGCRPDVVTYTALIQAYERGGQWRRALGAFEEMQARPCAPDAIVYNAIVDVLWETGLAWAQRKAVQLFRQASQEGLIRRHSHVCADSIELNLHSTTAGVALLSLHCWLQDLCEKLQAEGAESFPEKVCIIAGKGKSKDASHSIIKETVTALLRTMRAPFKESPDSTAYIGRLEASGQQVSEWLAADGPALLTTIIPPAAAAGGTEAAAGVVAGEGSPVAAGEPGTPHATAAAGLGRPSSGSGSGSSSSQDEEVALQAELSTEARVREAFKTVKFFEETHCLNLQVMGYGYMQQRAELISLACSIGVQLALPDEAVYDAVLLLDRVMSIPLKVADSLLGVTMTACLLVAAKQSGIPDAHLPALADMAQVTGVPPELLSQMHANVLAALNSDTASISALRCLKLYLERIGGDISPSAEKVKNSRSPFRLLHETLADSEFLNYRPSVVAAAVLFADRKSRGLAPYWPSALSSLTGYSIQSTPELAAAVAGAQRLHDKLQVPAALWNFQPAAGQAGSKSSQPPTDTGGGGAASAPSSPGPAAAAATAAAPTSAAAAGGIPAAAAAAAAAAVAIPGSHPSSLLHPAAAAQLLPGTAHAVGSPHPQPPVGSL